MIRRFSSRRQKIDQYFLNERVKGARAYDRIAGYFSSSILEVAGEALESMGGPIRVICNSGLNLRDVETATAARYAQRREWCASKPENYGEKARGRFERLYDFLRSETVLCLETIGATGGGLPKPWQRQWDIWSFRRMTWISGHGSVTRYHLPPRAVILS